MNRPSPYPAVSVILPTLNARTFLEERIGSILNQTFRNWELIIVDSRSDDGTWEYLNRIRSRGQEIFRYQVPKGLYQAWNFGISKARGTYVYIATADDTMKPDCLERMVNALEAHPGCDICDSMLELLDSDGREVGESSVNFVAHYWHFDFPRNQAHVRKRPHDFFLHLGGKTVYTSITQILIRKSLFEKTGPFQTCFGRSADFQWGMLAALHADVVYLPMKLASWRLHSGQATAADPEESRRDFPLMLEMAERIVGELRDPVLKKKSMRFIRLMYFKSLLLSAKRLSDGTAVLRSALLASLRHPLMFAEFAVRSLRFRGESSLWPIRAYDSMILSRMRGLRLSHLIVAEEDAEAGACPDRPVPELRDPIPAGADGRAARHGKTPHGDHAAAAAVSESRSRSTPRCSPAPRD